MPEGGGENLPRVVSKINDPVEKLNLQRKTADLVAQGVPNDPKQGKDDAARRGVAESLAIRDMAGKRYIHRQTEKRKKAEELSLTDSLTGLPNRRALNKRLGEDFSRAKREKKPLSAGILDIDFFKRVNDKYGHGVGDQVLQEAARVMQRELREYDVVVRGRAPEDADNDENSVARPGGEEFVLDLPDTNEVGAMAVGERVRVALSADQAILRLLNGVPLTASIGFATMNPQDASIDTPQRLLDLADAALYTAKEAGRDRSVMASPDMKHPPRPPFPPNSPK